MTDPLPLEVGGIARYKADRSYSFSKELDGEIVIIRRIDKERKDFQYWVENVNTSKNGVWGGTWVARRELRKMPDRKEGN